MRWLTVLVLAAGCGSGAAIIGDAAPAPPDAAPPDAAPPDAAPPDAAPPDAAPPDAAATGDARPPGILERIDWRTTRGEPLAASTLRFPASEIFALTDDAFVLRAGCEDPLGCTYTWHDASGAVRRRRDHLVGVTATTVSGDGRRALLLTADETGPCEDEGGAFFVARGTLEILDLASGETDLDLVLRTNPWTALAFTPGARWFFAAPIADGQCVASRLAYRSVDAPFAEAPGLEGVDFAQAIDARRWLAFRDQVLGVVVDPDLAGSFIALGESPIRFDVAGGWVHASFGFGNVAHEIVSLSPESQLRRTSVERDEDWLPFGAQGRWVRVCDFIHLPAYRDCRVLDVLGEVGPAEARVIDAEDHPDDAVLLGAGALVFVEPGDPRALRRLDLATGRVETLHDGDGRLWPLGGGEGAIFLQRGDAWLIEATREQRLGAQVRYVFTAPRITFLSQEKTRQDDLALLVEAPDGRDARLLALDMRTRRLAQLTDHLYLTPQLFPSDACGQPWVTRHAGRPAEGVIQDGSHLYFVEAGAPAALWILPIDLSSPPQRFAALSDPAACHAPLTSPGGGRIAFVEDDAAAGEAVVTLAAP